MAEVSVKVPVAPVPATEPGMTVQLLRLIVQIGAVNQAVIDIGYRVEFHETVPALAETDVMVVRGGTGRLKFSVPLVLKVK